MDAGIRRELGEEVTWCRITFEMWRYDGCAIGEVGDETAAGDEGHGRARSAVFRKPPGGISRCFRGRRRVDRRHSRGRSVGPVDRVRLTRQGPRVGHARDPDLPQHVGREFAGRVSAGPKGRK